MNRRAEQQCSSPGGRRGVGSRRATAGSAVAALLALSLNPVTTPANTYASSTADVIPASFQSELNEYLNDLNVFLANHDTQQIAHWLSTLANNEQSPDVISECLTTYYCSINTNDPATRDALATLLKYYELEESHYQTVANYSSEIDQQLKQSINYLKSFLSVNGISTTPPDTGPTTPDTGPTTPDTGPTTPDTGPTEQTGTVPFDNGVTGDPLVTANVTATTTSSSVIGLSKTEIVVNSVDPNTLDLDGDGTPAADGDTNIDIDGDGTPLSGETDPAALLHGVDLPTAGSVYEVITWNFLGQWQFVYADVPPLTDSAATALGNLLPSGINPESLVDEGITAELTTPFGNTLDLSWLFQTLADLGIDVDSMF